MINFGENQKQVQSYATKNNIELTNILDEESSLGETYSIVGVPTFIFIDQEGLVQAVEHALPENYEEILLAKKFSETKTAMLSVESKEEAAATNESVEQLTKSGKASAGDFAAINTLSRENPPCLFGDKGGLSAMCFGFSVFLLIWLFFITRRLEKCEKAIQEFKKDR